MISGERNSSIAWASTRSGLSMPARYNSQTGRWELNQTKWNKFRHIVSAFPQLWSMTVIVYVKGEYRLLSGCDTGWVRHLSDRVAQDLLHKWIKCKDQDGDQSPYGYQRTPSILDTHREGSQWPSAGAIK